jgi:hypothetical protein
VLYGASWFVTLGLSVALYAGGSFLVRRRVRAAAKAAKAGGGDGDRDGFAVVNIH